MANTTRSGTLGTRDTFVLDLVIQDETDAEVPTPYADPSEMVLAHEVDSRFDRIDSQRAAPLKCAPKSIEE